METGRKIRGLVLTAALLSISGTPLVAFAQPASEAVSAPATAASASLTKKELRAQRKAKRKAARARKNAELKQLESSGYRAGQYDPNYPANVPKAQQKATGTPASQ
ncbi:DUF4148 domain-containing protein [Burkholderia sp. Bp9015]|uniref:DUF4148 domain-containing protein n=1 Tax=Burkholderia sp. Bp9015 TaxID=2184563 RepID=UPI000F59D44B|nr:DUF4148 domain-containing protein [Burkholderia sp. Bp9015]RQR74784.1 DUF4148 domain-containing protein [Burkholderia sp. Bp9015]